MTTEQLQALDDRYQARFGNLDEIFHLSVITDPRWPELLQAAIDSGKKLDRAAIEKVFGEIGWAE